MSTLDKKLDELTDLLKPKPERKRPSRLPDAPSQEEVLSRDKRQAFVMVLFRRQCKLADMFTECRKHFGRAVWDSLADVIDADFRYNEKIITLLARKADMTKQMLESEDQLKRAEQLYERALYLQKKRETE